MQRTAVALCMTLVCCVSAGRAEENGSAALCRSVAHDFWSDVATMPLHEQTPLAQLPAMERGTTDIVKAGLAKADQPIASALANDHAADPALVQKLHDIPPAEATRFGDSDVWLFDRVEGSLQCHTPLIVAVPPDGPAHEIDLPENARPDRIMRTVGAYNRLDRRQTGTLDRAER